MTFSDLDQRCKRTLTKNFLFLCVSVFLICEIALGGALYLKILKFTSTLDYQAFTILPLFILGVSQILYNGRLQKTEFIRIYAERYFTNEALYTTFHELVYQYTDRNFDAVQAVVEDLERTNSLHKGITKPIFVYFDEASRNRKEGVRFYHPQYFQGSLEERRLDMLIGYFNLLGYYYKQGYFSIEEIAGSLGHYLNILSKRKIIQKVRVIYRDAIADPQYAKLNGRIEPFRYFEKLMLAIESFNLKLEERNARSLNIP